MDIVVLGIDLGGGGSGSRRQRAHGAIADAVRAAAGGLSRPCRRRAAGDLVLAGGGVDVALLEPGEAFRCYEATRIPRVADVQRISIENSWMRGPTETDWFYCYDPCTAPLTPPQ